MIRATHRATGETAILQKLPDGLCLAQFDRIDHPPSHHWHLYTRRVFRITPASGPRYKWKTVGDPRPRHR